MEAKEIGARVFMPSLATESARPSSRTAAARTTTGPLESERARTAAAKFEELFAALLVKEMRKSLPEGFFGDSADGDIYGAWFDQHVGSAIAKSGALHLLPIVARGLAAQEGAVDHERAQSGARSDGLRGDVPRSDGPRSDEPRNGEKGSR